MKKMSTAGKMLRGFREIHRLQPHLITLTIFYSISQALMPFVNLYFSAMILDVLSTTQEIRRLVLYVTSALVSNFFLFIISRTLENRYYMSRSLLYNMERSEVIQKLYTIDYERLEYPEFQTLVHKHQETMDRTGSALFRLSWMLAEWVKGITTITMSISLMVPLLKISFRTGKGFIESPWFAAILVAGIAAAVGIVLTISRSINKQWYKLNAEYMEIDKIYMYYTEMISNYKTGKEIRTYQEQELIEEDATNELLTKGIAIQKKIAANSAKSSSLIAVIGAILGFGIYLFIGLKGLVGLFGLGSLVKYTGSFMQVIQGITSLAMTFGQTSELIPTLDYYFDIINTQAVKECGTLELPIDDYELEFRNVSFKYPGAEQYALKNFSIKIGKDEHLAVVGRNGSGKTTFIKLLCRLYDPEAGEILINGINIKELSEDQYRKLFSVVFQDFAMFSFSLGQNISANRDYEEERVWNGLEKAGIDQRVKQMPNQMETFLYKDLDEKGIEISGGEAQKLALARALYKDAPFIILDEPTAALDPIAEFEIYSRFNSFVENKTAIYISHRLSSCRFCSKIAVFQKGELVQLGTHDELITDENGVYFELWNAQAQYYV